MRGARSLPLRWRNFWRSRKCPPGDKRAKGQGSNDVDLNFSQFQRGFFSPSGKLASTLLTDLAGLCHLK